jgi:hypothetical protein
MFEFVLMFIVIFMSSGNFKDSNPFEILAPGSFHQEDVEMAVDGEVWMGVFETSSGYELRPSEIVVEDAVDPYFDRDDERTARLIYATGAVIDPGEDWDWETDRWSVEGADRLMFLLHPADSVFMEGTLEPVITDSPQIPPDTTIELGTSVQLLVAREEGLFLVEGETEQRLSDVYPDSVGEFVAVVWAGDLDGDGRIDLVLDDRPHYAYRSYYRLFLSSEAEPGYLVKEVAVFIATGC